jgi:predicted transcriptional regulator of viral defense system
MKLVDAQVKLLSLKQPVIRTADAAACLKITHAHASKLLERLAKANIIVSLARGFWSLTKTLDSLALPEYLTAPFPSYISLQTALYYHGMISQMSSVVYAVSLARTRRYSTPLGVISIHHLDTDFFSDYTIVDDANLHIKIATPEKALLDVFYLAPAKSHLFKLLPELELPQTFSIKKAKNIINKIKSPKHQTMVMKKLEDVLKK